MDEDIIFNEGGRGVLYFCGGESGKFISVNKGLLSAGSYYGALLHIDGGYFDPELTIQFPSFDAANCLRLWSTPAVELDAWFEMLTLLEGG